MTIQNDQIVAVCGRMYSLEEQAFFHTEPVSYIFPANSPQDTVGTMMNFIFLLNKQFPLCTGLAECQLGRVLQWELFFFPLHVFEPVTALTQLLFDVNSFCLKWFYESASQQHYDQRISLSSGFYYCHLFEWQRWVAPTSCGCWFLFEKSASESNTS